MKSLCRPLKYPQFMVTSSVAVASIFLMGPPFAHGDGTVLLPLHGGHNNPEPNPVPFSPPQLTPGYFSRSDSSPNRPDTATGLSSGGLPYTWTMGAASHYAANFTGIVGARSWEDYELDQPNHGRVRSTAWLALELKVPASVTISLAQSASVPDFLSLLPGGVGGGQLKPAFTLYRGWQTSGTEGDRYHNRGPVAWATNISYIDHEPNNSGTESVSRTFQLSKGNYSLALGGASTASIVEGRQGFSASVQITSLAQPAAIGRIKKKYKTKKKRVRINGLFLNSESAAYLALQQNKKTALLTAYGSAWTASIAKLKKKKTNYVFVAAVSHDGSISKWEKIQIQRK